MGRVRHYCGRECGYCERQIVEIEYERDMEPDLPDYYDGT